MSNPIPEKLINFRVYLEGTDLLGTADVTLPSLESLTETVKGAGLAGEVESPVIGHFKSMTLGLKWRVVHKEACKLAVLKAHQLEVRGAVQVMDHAAGTYTAVPTKLVVKGIPKKLALGKMDPGKLQDTETELEVTYLKLTVDGEEQIELDKYNFIYKVQGEDQLAKVRSALGLE